ncbi:MAG: twin-arginine translocase TatA/TatE family subunit [Magnetococcales bacterium]|nr:twin-arginine translocase TatA/TatE family subunit [Magnetococcales bacterium]
MFGISMPELLIILLIVFIFFGAGKLPKMMSDLGKGMRSFKRSLNGDDASVETTGQGAIEGSNVAVNIKKDGTPVA